MTIARRTTRSLKKPDEWRPMFLDALRQCANVREACETVNVGYSTVYQHREADAEFAKAWDAAIKEAADRLEREAWRRAAEGVQEPVYQGGKMVGTIQKYSDTLLIFLLKGARPEKYRETVRNEHVGEGGGPIEVLVRRVDGPGNP